MLSNEKHYENIKKLLKPKNGNIYRVLITESYNMALRKEVEVKYNSMMDYIVENMQKEGYEILDVKLSVSCEHLNGYFNTIVTYK